MALGDRQAAEAEDEALADPAQDRLLCAAVLDGQDPETAAREERITNYGELRRELIGIERDELISLRGIGHLKNDPMRQIERDLDLDLEEARIRS